VQTGSSVCSGCSVLVRLWRSGTTYTGYRFGGWRELDASWVDQPDNGQLVLTAGLVVTAHNNSLFEHIYLRQHRHHTPAPDLR